MVAFTADPQQFESRLAAARLAYVTLMARQGDPLPFIDFQWPGTLLDEFQKDAICSLFDPTMRRVFMKGNTGCGKSAVAGLGVCIYFAIWPDSKVVLTSSTFDHCVQVLFGEVSQWYKAMRVGPGDELYAEGIGDPKSERYVQVVNPGNDESFSGRHGEHVLFVFDEATGVADSRFKMAKTQATKFLCQANPRTMSGAFRRAFPSENPDANTTRLTAEGKTRCLTIDGAQCLNVVRKRLEAPVGPPGGVEADGVRYEHGDAIPLEVYQQHFRPIIPGQICYDAFLSLCADGDPRWVQVFAHGKFPDENPDLQLVLYGWLERAYSGWRRYRKLCEFGKTRPRVTGWIRRMCPVQAFGLDVAGSTHGDKSVLTAGGRRGVFGQHAVHHASTMDTCGWVLRVARDEYGVDLTQGQVPVAVDMDGLGKGTGDRLRELNVRVIEIRGNDSAADHKLYANSRAERYATLGARLNPEGQFALDPLWLPEDVELAQELCAIEKIYQGSDGFRFAVTPKRKVPGSSYEGPTVADKIGRSPDKGDSCVYWWSAQQKAGRGNLSAWLSAGAF